MISSTSNSRVKETAALGKKAKYRKETGLFVVEGPKMAAELPEDRIHSIYVTERFMKEHGKEPVGCKVRKLSQAEVVTDEVMKAMSDTQTPQGILAVARQYEYDWKELLKKKEKAHLIILENLQDPGNLGTILRAGEGAGITGVIMDEETADIYNPKVIRSTMGSIFYVKDLKETLKTLKKEGVCLYGAHLKGSRDYDGEDYTKSMGFLIGNEARGLSEEIASMADHCVKIPMAGNVESLNAAIAASVLMFEAARQRRELPVKKS